jgi:RHS repeat-associated protein
MKTRPRCPWTHKWIYLNRLCPIAELDANNAVVSTFVYATGVNVLDYMVKGGVKYRLIRDQVGSVRLVVNAQTGEVAQRLDYDEFGRVLRDSNPGFQPFGFQGGLYDRDTGLVHFGARWPDPVTGRWLSNDPIGISGGLNQYVCSDNNPVNFSDPFGLCFNVQIVDGTKYMNEYREAWRREMKGRHPWLHQRDRAFAWQWSMDDGRDIGEDLRFYIYEGRCFPNGGAFGNYVAARVMREDWGAFTTDMALGWVNLRGFFQTIFDQVHKKRSIPRAIGAGVKAERGRHHYQGEARDDERRERSNRRISD